MANNEEDKGFRVVDRRVSAGEGQPPEQRAERRAEDQAQPPEQQAGGPAASDHAGPPGQQAARPSESGPSSQGRTVEGPGFQMKEEKPASAPAALPTVDFTTFCLSFASSAMVHLGLAPHPESGKSEKNLPLAKQTIDILALLQEKTQGNLTEGESKLLSTLLYDLRMRFVEAKR